MTNTIRVRVTYKTARTVPFSGGYPVCLHDHEVWSILPEDLPKLRRALAEIPDTRVDVLPPDFNDVDGIVAHVRTAREAYTDYMTKLGGKA